MKTFVFKCWTCIQNIHSAEAAEVEAAEGTEDSYPSSHMLSVKMPIITNTI